jgi:hypothetical protein
VIFQLELGFSQPFHNYGHCLSLKNVATCSTELDMLSKVGVDVGIEWLNSIWSHSAVARSYLEKTQPQPMAADGSRTPWVVEG